MEQLLYKKSKNLIIMRNQSIFKKSSITKKQKCPQNL
jgi:hypothetical protein